MYEDQVWKSIHVSVDVTNKTSAYIKLLKYYVRDNQFWKNENVVSRALYRYERLWLPLLAEWKGGELEPPSDVMWVWHLHMLNPSNYSQYCKGQYGKIIPHKIKTSSSEEKSAKERTSRVWNDKYLHEPYEIERDLLKSSQSKSPGCSRSLQHLIPTASHQAGFLYQVLLPHYTDTTFLRAALERYRQFVHLHANKYFKCAEPPNDIYLLWRIHMLHPYEYHNDMLASCNKVIDPHDTMSEVSGYMSDTGPDDVWFQCYGSALYVGGSCHRGTQYTGLTEFPKEYSHGQVVTSCHITIDDVMVTDVWTKDKDIYIEAKRIGLSSVDYTPFFLSKGHVGTSISIPQSKSGGGTIDFDTEKHRGIEFHIFSKKGRCCTRVEQHIATVFYNPSSDFSNKSFYSRTMPVEIKKTMSADANLKFTCHIKAVERNPHAFTMERTSFKSEQMPSDLYQCVMNEPSWEHGLHVTGNQDFLVATHQLQSKVIDDLSLNCCVVRHNDTDCSAVLIYVAAPSTGYRHSSGSTPGKLVCVAHTISSLQIPNIDQVSSDFPLHMDPDMDHAMLVRDHTGDIYIVKGSWATETMPGYGSVEITVYDLKKGTKHRTKICDDELHSIKLEHVTIDMPTGRLTLGPDCEEMAASVAVSYCAGILFLTCQKKSLMMPVLNGSVKSLNKLKSYDADKPQRFNTKIKLQNKRRNRKRKMSASFTFLLACGLQVDSFYYNISQPSSRNSTINLNDVPVVVNKDGDVKFLANATSNGYINGYAEPIEHAFGAKVIDDPNIQDIRL